ncbi:MAG: hypothetical protein J0I42_14850 [Bosea sp.]|uniref:hypothetical protein n=1 Tax=Bosea sp. (in: a-proteobacteria) TaxID=1871050 RepID=UPI001AD009BE|nr:hypothetical protein [Bosea sp. (in: a-proteobacteria)]MBN9453224.1 hypothetical protein [Bosea sp. (in: a-proteobacteria)]
MKDWCKGLPEATEFSLFPPAGQVRAWTADKEHTKARLREVFPDLTFAITDIALDASPVVIPILGEAGEGGRGMYASPPSDIRLREIEAALRSFDCGAMGQS